MSKKRDWNTALSLISTIIKDTETMMNDRALIIPADYLDLSWRIHGSSMRICFENKPLIEHPITVRAEKLDMLKKLVERAHEEMEKTFGALMERIETNNV